MICQKCGVEAPTRYVSFHQNIGLLVMRLSNSTEGNLCKSCIHGTFWTYTAINCTLGWWGMISLILTPIFIINNTVRFLGCLGMEPVPPGAVPPVLTEQVIERLNPHVDYIIQSMQSDQDFNQLLANVSARSGASPAQVALYVQALIQASQRQ